MHKKNNSEIIIKILELVLPDELIREILEYNPNHRIKHKNVMTELKMSFIECDECDSEFLQKKCIKCILGSDYRFCSNDCLTRSFMYC